jgi:Gram-negative bacterial tonB protein.
MSRHTRRLAFLGGFLWLACATRNPTDVAPASPSASSRGASSGFCFRGNENYGELRISNLSNGDAGAASPPTGGALSRKEVRGAVGHYMSVIKKCYQAANLRSPNLEGHVTVGMAVAVDGTVSDSWIRRREVGSAGGDAELEALPICALCEVVFPKPKGNASAVVYQAFWFGKGIISDSCYSGHRQESPQVSAPSRRAQPADAGTADASVPAPGPRVGTLDKEVIRGVIRSHISAVRACYETELSTKLGLQGRISYQFTIDQDGTVAASGIQSSTMNDARVEDCVGREICNWEFPKPLGGGIVIVSYPFNFTAGDAGDDGHPIVWGSLDKDVIRGVIRSHISAVRACYESELSANLDLKGRIACQFTIAADGKVIASALQSSSMKNGKVEDCVLREIRNWEFPKPIGGGIVIVSYPFNFTAGPAGEDK